MATVLGPIGMLWKTYLRPKSGRDADVQVSFHAIGHKFGFLGKSLEG